MVLVYTRDFGGIKSDGQLYNLEREYNQSRERFEPEPPASICEKPKGLKLDFLRDLKLDDLILIGIGILLLLDSDSENDIFVFLIAFLLIFN